MTGKVGRFSCYFTEPQAQTVWPWIKAGNLFVAHASLGTVFILDEEANTIGKIISCRGKVTTNVAFGGPNGGS